MESIKSIIVLSFLISTLVPSFSSADTTGNLILNGTFESGNSNNWTTTGEVTVLNDCCGSNYDLEFGVSGSIEQSFNLITDTITQSMLNNGITLNSNVQVQNGECGVAQCWGGSGPADSFTIQLQIKDSDNNVLATTTQERFNVTGINGKDFSDSVTYTQSGSNRGGIIISGADSNGVVGGLGGPNIDNVEVTMTYDPTVLTATQTEEIVTAITSVAELENEIEIIEFIPIEEITFEEYIEPEIITLFIEEIFIEELAQEEINTGIINIFEEVTYEEPQTIEAFATEVESFEETTETTEIGGTNEKIETVEVEEENTSARSKESERIESVSQRESEETTREQPSNSDEQTESNTRASEEDSTRENNASTNPNSGDGAESDAEVTEVVNQPLQVADVEKQVAQSIKEIDRQLVATSNIVASLMVTTNLDSYTNMNEDILIQPTIDGGNIDEYYSRNYSDGRNIYAEIQISRDDPVLLHQTKVQETVDQVIRAEEHLRRIRGY
mgnify:FL=1|tara:strand:- start:270 stop:1772 length:1503 start_codon:yes stop_codon:yes gene_type:complete